MSQSRSRTVRSILTVVIGSQEQSYLLEPGSTDIGRSISCAIRINHPEVSRKQAILTRSEEGRVKLIDGDAKGNKSTNGTFVNKTRVSDCWLKSGDVIHFGSSAIQAKFYQLTVQIPGQSESDPVDQERQEAASLETQLVMA